MFNPALLSMLPSGVVPGCVQIINMENIGVPAVGTTLENRLSDSNSPPLNSVQVNFNPGTSINATLIDNSQSNTGRLPISEGSLDILTSLMNGVAGSEQSVGFNYQVENKETQQIQSSSNHTTETSTSQRQSQASIPFLGGTLNINDLFQRLVASGIVQTSANVETSKTQTKDESPFDIIDFSNMNTLKEKYPSVVTTLYSGIQCSSCGVRFSPEETVKYSRHLDWHFRQNRREKDAAKKMRSRKWYYDVSDWIQFEEIEDLEERAQSWFDTETGATTEEQEQEDIKSVPAPQGEEVTRCEMCRDQFDTYYNEEKEEWHLKPCIIVEDKYYHPLCYEDLMSMPEDSLIANKTTDSSISNRDENPLQNDPMVYNEEEAEEKGEQFQKTSDESQTESKDHHNKRISPAQFLGQLIETKLMVENDCKKGEDSVKESDEDQESVIRVLLNELINCIVYKEEIELEDEEEVEEDKESKEEEIEVLENVTVEQKKNIIAVDLIEKIDDEEEEMVYQPKSPSPISFIPTIKIKQEPIDEMESPIAVVDQTYTNVVSSIDGNVEMIDTPQIAPAGPSKIKITFNKPIVSEHNAHAGQKLIIKDPQDISPEEVDPEPLPLKPKKPRIAEREMTVYLPCVKGTEVSGLCTIM